MTDDKFYQPEADSTLIAECITEISNSHPPTTALDVGLGSGILAQTIHETFPNVTITGIDINEAAIKHCKKFDWLTTIKSNLFENIKDGFDLIVCNPPYLPQDKFDTDDVYNQALVGGKKGYEYILRFLDQAKLHLNEGGKILLLFSSLSNKSVIDTYLHNSMYLVKQLAEKNVGMMDDLYVYQLTLPDPIFEIENPQFLAKGKRGLVVKGNHNKQTVVLKIPLDNTLAAKMIVKETKFLQKVNELGIGPKFIKSTTEYVMMEFVEGQLLKHFLKGASQKEITAVCDNIMEQCKKLDTAGINKFEMTKPLKHIIIKSDGSALLLDFERALFTNRPKNVTQFAEFYKKMSTRQ